MTIVCNGSQREVENRTLTDVLRELGFGQTMIATAVNGRFVPARQRDYLLLDAGDAIEVVTPRQGG